MTTIYDHENRFLKVASTEPVEVCKGKKKNTQKKLRCDKNLVALRSDWCMQKNLYSKCRAYSCNDSNRCRRKKKLEVEDSPATLHACPLILLRSLKLEIIFTTR